MLIPAVIAALEAAGLNAHEGEPSTTPSGMYASVTGEAGLSVPHRAGTRAHWVDDVARVMLIARTPDGRRAAIEQARDALQGAVLIPGSTPLTEVVSGPDLSGGPTGDIRLTATLTYRTRRPRSVQ